MATRHRGIAARRPTATISNEYCYRCGDHAPQPDGYQARLVIICDTCSRNKPGRKS